LLPCTQLVERLKHRIDLLTVWGIWIYLLKSVHPAGVGAEVVLAGNWTGKFEYLYMDLGSLDDLDAEISPPRVISVSGGQTLTHTTFTDNIFRVGLNYKFN
jgi:outer membrane immunogenic protein